MSRKPTHIRPTTRGNRVSAGSTVDQQRVCHSHLKRHDDGRHHGVVDRRGRNVAGHTYVMKLALTETGELLFLEATMVIGMAFSLYSVFILGLMSDPEINSYDELGEAHDQPDTFRNPGCEQRIKWTINIDYGRIVDDGLDHIGHGPIGASVDVYKNGEFVKTFILAGHGCQCLITHSSA